MKRTLFEDAGLAVVVAGFAPGEVQPAHRDQHSRVTFLLRGRLAEAAGDRQTVLGAGALLFKSNEVLHEDRIAEEGAAALSLVFQDPAEFDAAGPPGLWRPLHSAQGLRAAIALTEAALARDAAGLQLAAAELLAAAGEDEAGRRTAPPWLARLKSDLEEAGLAEIDVADRAREAGCHPVHASRLFRRAYGASITDHAQVHAVRRAQGRLAQGGALSDAALAAGFYDQSHMNRVFRRVAGVTPGDWRRLSGAVLAG